MQRHGTRAWRLPFVLVVLALMLGAVTTAAVAWRASWASARAQSIAETIQVSIAAGEGQAGRLWSVTIARNPTWTWTIAEVKRVHALPEVRTSRNAPAPLRKAAEATFAMMPRDELAGTPLYEAVRWSGLWRLAAPGPAFRHSAVKSYGWPMRAMWMSEDLSGASSFSTTVVRRKAYGSRWGWMPLGVHAAGFVLDTLLFALPWLAVFFVPAGVRAWRRRRGGGCGKCGYDLAGLRREGEGGAVVCPECGTTAGPS